MKICNKNHPMEIKLQMLERYLEKLGIEMQVKPTGGFVIYKVGHESYTIEDIGNNEVTTSLPRIVDEERLIALE